MKFSQNPGESREASEQVIIFLKKKRIQFDLASRFPPYSSPASFPTHLSLNPASAGTTTLNNEYQNYILWMLGQDSGKSFRLWGNLEEQQPRLCLGRFLIFLFTREKANEQTNKTSSYVVYS